MDFFSFQQVFLLNAKKKNQKKKPFPTNAVSWEVLETATTRTSYLQFQQVGEHCLKVEGVPHTINECLQF